MDDQSKTQARKVSSESKNTEPAAGRNRYLDSLKGALILLVVYGHAIQYIAYADDGFWANPVFKVIYMFHMPLFMAISGYFAWSTINRLPLFEILTRRFLQLILPIISWTILIFGVISLLDLFFGRISLPDLLARFPKQIVSEALHSLWFLWALYFSVTVMACLRRLKLDKPWLLLLLCLISLWIPDARGVTLLKFIFPFFCIGYFLRPASDLLTKIPAQPRLVLSCLALIGAGVCYALWQKQTYIYNSGSTLPYLGDIALRLLAGLTCSIIFVALTKRLFGWMNPGWLEFVGKSCFSIYVIQSYLMDGFIATRSSIPIPFQNTPFAVFVIAPLACALIIAICLAAEYLIRKNSTLALLFLGAR